MPRKSANLVSIEWLNDNLENPDIIILDATMKRAPSGDLIPEPDSYIPSAQSFNFDTEICDQNSQLPHMLCSEKDFELAAQKLGINNNSVVVVYDAMGIFSSPRAWWMFRIMGHKNVFVVNGGLPKWLQANYPTTSSLSKLSQTGNFTTCFKPLLLSSPQQVFESISEDKTELIDARSKQRFLAKEAEPRAGLRRGHIPSSSCIPFTELLEDGLFKSKQQLKRIFRDFESNFDHAILSCGSGVTACILALGASECGYQNWSIYDGSWSEWGADSKFPIEPH